MATTSFPTLWPDCYLGYRLAVTSFNRYSRLVEALGRRLCLVLVSMYFDDANIVDWKSSGGSGQAAFNTLNELLGTPFSLEKKQLMSPEGTFLGLVHQLEDCMALGRVTFWVKPKLQEKAPGHRGHGSEVSPPDVRPSIQAVWPRQFP